MSDQLARQTALDTTSSFIVQAPAGSGKTELLIQRFLALLATVEQPEQVVAITFTRKAAAEMRARVLRALRAAAEQEPAPEAHRLRTRDLASAVLARSQQLDWDLTTQPQRLRIDTLDALNAWLAQRLPILAGGVSGANVMENATELYTQATRRVLEELGRPGDVGESLQPLLRRLDNRYDRLETLLAELLPRREQWLHYLATGGDTELRSLLERGLQNLVEEQLERVIACLPEAAGGELVELLRHAAEAATNPTFSAALRAWRSLECLPAATAGQLSAWQALPELLLIKNGNWRKQLRADIGFGADHDAEKLRLRDLIATLETEAELRESLATLRSLPAPHYDEAQWQILASLRIALRHLVAELRVVFAERACVDFVELALAAQSALGETDAPSELLLALDHRIQHILVDEFQDTSHTQLRLLELLTAGWQPADGRTLFLVGDPMQSIYRFRNADMSLFLKTQAKGLGDVHCRSLTLTRNFRSAPAVIDWVNATFPTIFPERDEVGAGAARFHPCESVRDTSPDTGVEFHALRNADPRTEVDRVIEILVDERSRYPEGSVAILVQSRGHLAGLHEQLRARQLEVHAVELEAPKNRQVIQDLLGLTRALTHLADRVAWLGVLRAPWCGMTWRDLHELAANDHERPLWALVNDPRCVESVSENGRLRLSHCRKTLQRAFDCRAQQPLSRWIERTWVTLGGPACLDSTEELEQADRFFGSLAEIEHRGDLDDPPSLEYFFSDPRGHGDVPAESGVEIMTIHRAKGLEFDSVLILGLSRVPRPDQGRGLYWLERVADNGKEDLLLAPLTATADEPDALADYLKRVDRERDYAERARLMYVATTRARNRLNLVGQLGADTNKPDPRSLLALLWPSVKERFDGESTVVERPAETEIIQPVLRRLTKTYDLAETTTQPAVSLQPDTIAPRPEFEWAGQAALQIGTVVHNALQTMAEAPADEWNADRVRAQSDRFRAELRLLGVEETELSNATDRVTEALFLVLEDATGCWLLRDHAEAASELPMTIYTAAGLEHVRLDRTFVDDNGTRWIIDFKTSAHEGGSTAKFLDSEVERYRSQLERYASAMAAVDDRPIRVGLYFPLLQAFRDWAPDIR